MIILTTHCKYNMISIYLRRYNLCLVITKNNVPAHTHAVGGGNVASALHITMVWGSSLRVSSQKKARLHMTAVLERCVRIEKRIRRESASSREVRFMRKQKTIRLNCVRKLVAIVTT